MRGIVEAIKGNIPNCACLLNSSRLRPRKPRFKLGVTLILGAIDDLVVVVVIDAQGGGGGSMRFVCKTLWLPHDHSGGTSRNVYEV
jgi:hypothetical protein